MHTSDKWVKGHACSVSLFEIKLPYNISTALIPDPRAFRLEYNSAGFSDTGKWREIL